MTRTRTSLHANETGRGRRTIRLGLLELGARAASPRLVEAALAHQQADKVVAAYARTTYLDRRRELMEEWGRFCMGR